MQGFKYSAPLAKAHEAGEKWTYEHLYHFLKKPSADMPGTAMGFAGLPKPEDRANVIAYLRTLSLTRCRCRRPKPQRRRKPLRPTPPAPAERPAAAPATPRLRLHPPRLPSSTGSCTGGSRLRLKPHRHRPSRPAPAAARRRPGGDRRRLRLKRPRLLQHLRRPRVPRATPDALNLQKGRRPPSGLFHALIFGGFWPQAGCPCGIRP